MVKPCVVGTTARASKENVRSIGFSIYYTMVNIGGAAGPYIAEWRTRNWGWRMCFGFRRMSVFADVFSGVAFVSRAEAGGG